MKTRSEPFKLFFKQELNVMIAKNSYHQLFEEPKREQNSDAEESSCDVKPSISELLELKIETINKDFDKKNNGNKGDNKQVPTKDENDVDNPEEGIDDDMTFDDSEEEQSDEDEKEVKANTTESEEIKFEEEDKTATLGGLHIELIGLNHGLKKLLKLLSYR